MAKPTKNAPQICTAVTIIALVGVVVGLIIQNALPMILLLLPTVIYEVYRTEGKSTRYSSVVLLIVLVAEIFLLLFNVNFNLAEFLGVSTQYVAGHVISLGDIKIVGGALVAVLSLVLMVRTYGIYTKWLAGVIFIGALAIVYILDPVAFQELARLGVQEGFEMIDN